MKSFKIELDNCLEVETRNGWSTEDRKTGGCEDGEEVEQVIRSGSVSMATRQGCLNFSYGGWDLATEGLST